MIQTRAEAASLVVQLQRTAVTQGLLFYGIAAITALSFMTAVIVWIAVAAPPAWRGWALGIVSIALLATAISSALTAGRKIRRDAGLIADFSRGIKLDLAMVNLALKDPDTENEEKLAERERAKTRVREAAAEKAATPSTAEGGGAPSPEGPSVSSATAAMRAAPPRPDASPSGRVEGQTGAGEATVRADLDVAARGGKAPAAAPAFDEPPRPQPSAAGFALTGGGTYASTSPPREPVVVDEHAMPGSMARAGETHPISDDTERKKQHGSA
jgi:uncharacterized membrane protein YqjE